jgi:hypothetical protein
MKTRAGVFNAYICHSWCGISTDRYTNSRINQLFFHSLVPTVLNDAYLFLLFLQLFNVTCTFVYIPGTCLMRVEGDLQALNRLEHVT